MDEKMKPAKLPPLRPGCPFPDADHAILVCPHCEPEAYRLAPRRSAVSLPQVSVGGGPGWYDSAAASAAVAVSALPQQRSMPPTEASANRQKFQQYADHDDGEDHHHDNADRLRQRYLRKRPPGHVADEAEDQQRYKQRDHGTALHGDSPPRGYGDGRADCYGAGPAWCSTFAAASAALAMTAAASILVSALASAAPAA